MDMQRGSHMAFLSSLYVIQLTEFSVTPLIVSSLLFS